MSLDPFLQYVRGAVTRSPAFQKRTAAPAGHGARAHSKFSASGAERWFNCPGSVELSEGLPDKSSPWAIEGTEAHEVLETILIHAIKNGTASVGRVLPQFNRQIPRDMLLHAIHAANFILATFTMARLHGPADLMVETRIYLDFIHPEMFGTFDGGVAAHFDTLDVFDYKYGQGHAVSPVQNLQMLFYGIGLAEKYHWNFKRVRLWIIQPRIKGYDGPLFWELPALELKGWVGQFRSAVARVEREPETYVEGSWCHWCKAKGVCPLKREAKLDAAKSVFSIQPVQKGFNLSEEEIKEARHQEKTITLSREDLQARISEAELRAIEKEVGGLEKAARIKERR